MKTRLDLIPVEDADGWAAALRGVPHSFHHTWEFAYAQYLATDQTTFLLSVGDGTSRMVCPLVERDFTGHLDVATPSGLSGFAGTGAWSWFSSHWSRFVHDKGYVSGFLGLHPMFQPQDLPTDPTSRNSIYVLYLSPGLEQLQANLDHNRRRELRGWADRAPGFVLDRDRIAEFVIAQYGPFMRRVGARPPYLTPPALELLCRSDDCLAVATEDAGEVDNAFVFGVTPYAGDWLINIATDTGRPNNTDLLWYGVRALVEKRVPALSLGGGARQDDDVAKAKQRYGPTRLPIYSMREVYRPAVYAELCRIAGADPQAPAEYFPAYREPTVGGPASRP